MTPRLAPGLTLTGRDELHGSGENAPQPVWIRQARQVSGAAGHGVMQDNKLVSSLDLVPWSRESCREHLQVSWISTERVTKSEQ